MIIRSLAAAALALLLPACAVTETSPDALTRAGRRALAARREKLETQGVRSFDRPAEAHEFFLAQRLTPWQPVYPMPAMRAELDDVLAREQVRAEAPAAGLVATWRWLGPGNSGGRTRALAIDPTDPDVMYAGGVGGGIWKSVDAGASWAAADDLMLNLAITSIAIDPGDPGVLYAGTGEGVLTGRPGIRGLGIFKSTDAGVTWSQLPGTVQGVPAGAFHYVNEVAVSPSDSGRIYAATRFGVWRSLDAGQTWQVVLSNPSYLGVPPTTNGSQVGCTDIAIRPDSSPDVIFACFGSFQADGLYRSDDGGDSWVAYPTGVAQGRMTVAFAPSDNDIVYLIMANNGATGQVGQLINVYRSLDGGLTWTPRVDLTTVTGPWLLSNLVLATGCLDVGYTYSQGWYDQIIAVDPVDPDVVWVGGVDIFRSDDGGVTWGIPAYWIFYLADEVPPYNMHPDHHNIVFHPGYDGVANQTMYVTNDGGIFRTTNARAATSQEDCPLPPDEPLPELVWESLNNNYGVTQFYHGDSARHASVFVGGAQDNGTNGVWAEGTPNDWDLIYGGDGGYVAIDPADPDVIYAEIQFFPTFVKSTDGGETFTDAVNGITDTDGLFITPYAMDQAEPDVLWTGGSRIWRTVSGAAQWQLKGPDFIGPNQVSAVAIAPSDGNVVYLGYNNGYVARTTNGLAVNPAWEVFSDGLYGAWVSSVAVDPQDTDVAYVTYSSFGVPHVLRTVDGGQSWQSIDGIGFEGVPDIPAHWIAVRPCDSAQLFVGTELGVFASEDAGQTWAPFNDGLAHVVVESLDFKTHNELVAFTHGRGAFIADLPLCGDCPADLDGDGVVGVLDLLELLAQWGGDPGGPPDFDGDGTVGITDLLTLLAGWGPCPGRS